MFQSLVTRVVKCQLLVFFKKNTILPHNKYPINLVGQAWGTFGPTGVTGVQLPSLMAILSGADGSYSPKAFGGTQVPHPCGRWWGKQCCKKDLCSIHQECIVKMKPPPGAKLDRMLNAWMNVMCLILGWIVPPAFKWALKNLFWVSSDHKFYFESLKEHCFVPTLHNSTITNHPV